MTFRGTLLTIQRFWLFLLIVATPFSLAYIVNRGVAISYLNVFSVIFIGLGVVNLLTGGLHHKPFKDKGTLAVIGGLLLAMAYALLFTHPLRNGIGLWTSRLLQPLLVGFFTYELVAAQIVKVEEIVKAFFVTIPLLVVGGVLQLLHVIPAGEDPKRVTVFYEFPNTFARYVVILLTVTFPWLLFKQGKRPLFQWALWGLGVLLLLASQSYNGTVSCVIGGAVMVALLLHSYRKPALLALVGLGLLVLVVGFNVQHLPKYQTSITDSRLTRLEFWHIATGTIRDHPWTGIGIKGWETQYGQLVEKYNDHFPPYNWSSPQPHNVFLDSLLKAGIPGLIAITLLLLWPLIRGIQLFQASPISKYGWFGLSMVGYGIAMLAFGLIDDPLWSDDTMPLLFIFLALIMWTFQQTKKSRPTT